MVVAEAGHPGDGTGRVLPAVVVDEGEALRTERKRVQYRIHYITETCLYITNSDYGEVSKFAGRGHYIQQETRQTYIAKSYCVLFGLGAHAVQKIDFSFVVVEKIDLRRVKYCECRYFHTYKNYCFREFEKIDNFAEI